MSQALTGNKQVFISDIHMGDQRSMTTDANHTHPYGWLIKNIANLTNFLSDQLKARDVGQVVILGDLFDRWVFPTNFEPPPPLQYLEDICEANQDIIDNLQALAKSGKLSYVPGNHDMSFCQEDISDFKKFINDKFEGINFICYENDEKQPTGVYHAYNNKLVAEHGNMYCVFNAPDIWTNHDSFLPLGYFISRIVAYKVWRTGKGQCIPDIIYKYIKQLEIFKKEPDFIEKFLFAVAGDAGLDRDSPINMHNISGFPESIPIVKVADSYKDLMANWDKDENHKKNGSWTAAEGDYLPDGLAWPAYAFYLGPGTNPNFKVAIFGHTHVYEMRDFSLNPPRDTAIYVNSGTWVDSKPCTYVETEVDKGKHRHYVRIKSYPGNQLIREMFATL